MAHSTEISSFDDIIDVRDIIARVEELETEREDVEPEGIDPDDAKEYATLTGLLDDLKGYGGDEQWRGDWYPVTLVRDSYFTDYAREMVEELSEMPEGFPSYIEIDWNATARNIRIDYSSVEYEDVTYWYR